MRKETWLPTSGMVIAVAALVLLAGPVAHAASLGPKQLDAVDRLHSAVLWSGNLSLAEKLSIRGDSERVATAAQAWHAGARSLGELRAEFDGAIARVRALLAARDPTLAARLAEIEPLLWTLTLEHESVAESEPAMPGGSTQ